MKKRNRITVACSVSFCLILSGASFFLFLRGKRSPNTGYASFTAGTVAATEKGLRAIETLAKGDKVFGWQFATGEWGITTVRSKIWEKRQATVVTVQAGESSVEATYNHPFWVVRAIAPRDRHRVQEVPLEERGGTARGSWVEARDLLEDDVLLTRDGRELSIDMISTRSEQQEFHIVVLKDTSGYASGFAVGSEGILVSAHRYVPPDFPEKIGPPLCFSASTEVLTASGPQAIETITKGSLVYTWRGESQIWELNEVLGLENADYKGDMIRLLVGNVNIEVTGNHPFWVSEGAGLEERSAAKDVPRLERGMTAVGRWVEARDLLVGDVLLCKDGVEVTVERLLFRRRSLTVYNLRIKDSHTYAVSPLGILVHNKGSAEKVAP